MASKRRRRREIGRGGAKQHPGLPDPQTIAMVDLFLFLLDSRIPSTSLRIAEPYLLKRSRVYVMTKSDLADPDTTDGWVRFFRSQGWPCFVVKSNTGQGISALIEFLNQKQEELGEKAGPGLIVRPLRLMLFGLPNVGKSSLANKLLESSKAAFGAKPGLTRGSHWLRHGLLEILDTPGVLDTSQAKGDVLCKLAVTWALRDNQYDEEEVAFWLIKHVLKKPNPLGYLSDFGKAKGFIGRGARVDLNRASTALIRHFREGKLGRLSLEKPET